MQFTLSCRDEDGTLTEKRFDGIFLDDVVAKTEDFLKGVGFVFETLEAQVYPVDEESNPEFLTEDESSVMSSIYNSTVRR
ncbi:hypothetical protein [Synechococcus phage S-B64]|uniref:Uncharacterized protein n=2 Tax=Shandvirus TaxID=2948904 RepID=A0A1Z1LW75_9CAUD|nr:hypothetical protein KNT63_gp039 [Synechococcus phage S-H35]YP_010095390.1 hypothetical protein KNT88_gp152 [Synechococcus phage S-B64]ARW56920.1 hypothetical protein [Synechococcus phage S-H35]AWD90188.1 hypothetical protein [Synechococcus phage S-B64]